MNILLTGSNGFIGSNLKNYYKLKGHNVFEINKENGFDLSKNDWTIGIPKINFEIVVHLAQSKHYRDFENNSNDIFRVNIQSTSELLNWAKLNNIKKFIYTSSANVYDNSNIISYENSSTNYNSFYDLTKILSESIISFYSKYFQILILRLNTVYGPGQKDTIIPKIINKVKNKEEIVLARGKGIFLNPIYIDDLIHIIYNLSLYEFDNQKEVFNVSSDETISLHEIALIISKFLSNDLNLKITDEEVKYFLCDISKLKSHFEKIKFSKFKNVIKDMINE